MIGRAGIAAATAIIFALASADAQQTTQGPSQTPQPPAQPLDFQGWSTFNGDLAAEKYSTNAQITPGNVADLKEAWEFHTGDVSLGGNGKPPETYFEATPIFANNTVYIGTPYYRIVALTPDTGKVKWTFDPHAELKALTQPGMKSRGVAYWQSANPVPGQPCQKIVYVGTMDAKLFAVDADTGKRCQNFGTKGMVDVNQWNSDHKFPLSLLQPPTVYKNMLFVGWSGKDWSYERAPIGYTLALDAQTGKLKWKYNPFPPGAGQNSGTADVWASMSVDPSTNTVFLPVSSPSANFYGGNRKEPLPTVTSVTALDADTGKLKWATQLVHHDVWDFDTNSAPVLVNITRGGQVIPALVQSTKMGFLFVLNRLNGQPIFPVREEPVPQTNVPGDSSSPTQPVPVLPQPLVPKRWPGISTLADIAGFGQCSREFRKLRYEGWFTPPSIGGSMIYPATPGGVEWGGGAVDPERGIYVVNNSYTDQIYKLIPRAQYNQRKAKGDVPADWFEMQGSPYAVEVRNFTNWLGMPCWKPPYGSLTAIDLKTGQQLWKEPFGEVQRWGFYMPYSWGSITIGAPLITKTGLIFIGASMDSRARAIDINNGKVLWTGRLDAPAVSIPATYTYNGKQYVVFTAGGNHLLVPGKLSDQVIAFALPS